MCIRDSLKVEKHAPQKLRPSSATKTNPYAEMNRTVFSMHHIAHLAHFMISLSTLFLSWYSRVCRSTYSITARRNWQIAMMSAAKAAEPAVPSARTQRAARRPDGATRHRHHSELLRAYLLATHGGVWGLARSMRRELPDMCDKLTCIDLALDFDTDTNTSIGASAAVVAQELRQLLQYLVVQ